ncbi:MAG: hydrolase, partial [Saprospiraceae bacterium]|nr:hydrolase [Saprospiraceae bacterium]
MKKNLLLTFFVSVSLAAFAQEDPYTLHIRKAQAPIVLDGKLDEPDWQSADVAKSFKLSFPNDTAFSNWPTEAKVTFDDEFLYVG